MISPDLPIKEASEDLLNRTRFAESLASAIQKYDNPNSFSIGLYGPWGSGKTSLINLTLGKLVQIDNEIVVLRFNPWMCSDPQQLISQFFAQLASAIKLKREAAGQAIELIGQFGELFKLAGFVPKFGGLIAGAGNVMVGAAKLHQEPNLQKKKDEIIKKLNEEQIKIVVSIDDIDRLSETEIVAVFQLVKTLADFPNTVYLLSFDREVVIKALGKVQSGKGEEYLEKVVQVPFEIPRPNMTNIYETFFSKLNEILGGIPEEKWDDILWSELFLYGFKRYITSLRDVVRFGNVFALKYQLLKDETDLLDLLGITCLQVFESSAYSELSHQKETLCGVVDFFSYETEKEKNEQIKKCIEGVLANAKRKEAAKKILGILFPRVNNALEQHCSGRSYNTSGYIAHKNISAAECFDRYFSLSLEDDAIPSSIIESIVFQANEDECKDMICNLYESGKIPRLLDEIQGLAENRSSSHISEERIVILISVLSRLWHTFQIEDKSFFSISPDIKFKVLIMSLLRNMRVDLRTICLTNLFQDEQVDLKTLAILLDELQAQHGRFTQRTPSRQDAALTLDDVITLEDLFQRRASEKLNNWTSDPAYDLFFLRKLEQISPEVVSGLKKSLVQNNVSLLSVIKYCTAHGKYASRVVERTWRVDTNELSQFVDVEYAISQVDALTKSDAFVSLPKNLMEDAIAFLLSQQATQEEDWDGFIPEHAVRNRLKEILRDNTEKDVNEVPAN